MISGPSVLAIRRGISSFVGGVAQRQTILSPGGRTAWSVTPNGRSLCADALLTKLSRHSHHQHQHHSAVRTRTLCMNNNAMVRIYSSFTNCTTRVQQGHVRHAQQQQSRYLGPLISSGRIPFHKTSAFPLLQKQLGAASQFSSQIPPPRRGGSRMAQGAGLLGAASLLFGKTKYVLAALKLTKLASLGSMVVSIGAYSMFFGLPYACGMVGLITVHEAGHAYVMHLRGMPFSPMVFLPFSKLGCYYAGCQYGGELAVWFTVSS